MILPVITAIVCVMSFMLLLRDMDEHRLSYNGEDAENEKSGKIPLFVWIYSAFCVVLTVVIAVYFPIAYPMNSFWVNIKRMTLLAILWPIAYIDARTYRIPNAFILFGLVCRAVILVLELFLGHEYIWETLVSELIASGALLLACVLCVLLVKNGIGFGDMKLFIVMGLLLGSEAIWGSIFMTLIISFLIAIFVLLTGKKSRKDAIPFGPAIVIGTYLSIYLSGV